MGSAAGSIMAKVMPSHMARMPPVPIEPGRAPSPLQIHARTAPGSPVGIAPATGSAIATKHMARRMRGRLAMARRRFISSAWTAIGRGN